MFSLFKKSVKEEIVEMPKTEKTAIGETEQQRKDWEHVEYVGISQMAFYFVSDLIEENKLKTDAEVLRYLGENFLDPDDYRNHDKWVKFFNQKFPGRFDKLCVEKFGRSITEDLKSPDERTRNHAHSVIYGFYDDLKKRVSEVRKYREEKFLREKISEWLDIKKPVFREIEQKPTKLQRVLDNLTSALPFLRKIVPIISSDEVTKIDKKSADLIFSGISLVIEGVHGLNKTLSKPKKRKKKKHHKSKYRK